MTSEAAATSNESITSSLEESITSTIASINSTLLLLLNQQQLDNATSLSGDYSIFLSREVLARPPFQYVYGLVECLARALPSLQCWKRLLFDDLCIPRNRKEKVCFSVYVITCNSYVSLTQTAASLAELSHQITGSSLWNNSVSIWYLYHAVQYSMWARCLIHASIHSSSGRFNNS
jgi:hypothetical protein